MAKMTIAAGLKELKLIDKKIESRTQKVGNLSAGFSTVIPSCGTAEAQVKKVESLIQSVKDLISRKHRIKAAIMAANLKTKVKYGGSSYTLQEVLFMKESGRTGHSGRELHQGLLGALRIDDRIEKEIERIKNEGKAPDDLQVARYFDVNKRERMEVWLESLINNLDNLLEHANFTTEIGIEPLPAEEV